MLIHPNKSLAALVHVVDFGYLNNMNLHFPTGIHEKLSGDVFRMGIPLASMEGLVQAGPLA